MEQIDERVRTNDLTEHSMGQKRTRQQNKLRRKVLFIRGEASMEENNQKHTKLIVHTSLQIMGNDDLIEVELYSCMEAL